MEGVDRINELTDEMLVTNIMSRLNCTTKELIRTTATISKRWKNLWTQLPHLIFLADHDGPGLTTKAIDLHGYISFFDNTLNQCPTNLDLKKFKLDINYDSRINPEFKSRADSWIRYAISRNVEEVDLRLYDQGIGYPFCYDDELFFNNSCFKRVKLSNCEFDPYDDVISWEKLKCLCLYEGSFDEILIRSILSGSPCLESLELMNCYGYERIDITSKSVKELVISGYNSNHKCTEFREDYIDAIEINAPYISSLTIKKELVLRELVLLDVSSLIKVDLDYSIGRRRVETSHEAFFKVIFESLYHVKDISFYNDYCWELYCRLYVKDGSDVSDDEEVETGD
ncbi:ribonuclease H-like domain-containing protein [Tanacetum coccineum]